MTMLGGVDYYAKCLVYESDQTTGTDSNDVAGDWSFIGSGAITKGVYIGNKVEYVIKIFGYESSGGGIEFVVKNDGTTIPNVLPRTVVESAVPSNASVWTAWVAANNAKINIGSTKVIANESYKTVISSKNNQSVTFTPAFVPKVLLNGIWTTIEFKAGFEVPTIIYTKANKTVKPPATVTAYDQIGSLQVGGGVSGGQAVQSETWYAWNSCNSEWVRVWLSNPKEIRIAQGGLTDIEFDVSVKYFDAAGFKKRPDNAYLPKIAKTKQKTGVKDRIKTQHAPGSLTQEAKKELERARDCGISVAVSTPNGGGSSVDDSKYGGGRWNPPPHIITRHFSPIANSQDKL